MEPKTALGAVLRTLNDQTAVHPYGDGLLLDLPFSYGDGDAVRVLVEPMGDGYRVSDRAAAATLLMMAGVSIGEGRAAEAFAETMRSVGLNGLNAAPGEVATFGDVNDLGRLILDVAQASLRIDQLRWLAARRARVRFVDQVAERVKVWAGEKRQVNRDAPIPLQSGRSRIVTLRVAGGDKVAYIQALSSRDQEQAAEHCFYIFGLSKIPNDRKIAALNGSPRTWSKEMVSELQTVGDVEFFDDPLSLERHLDRIVPPVQRALSG